VRRLGAEDLSARRQRADPGGAVDADPERPLADGRGDAGVEAHPNPQLQVALRRHRRTDAVAGGREACEDRIALGVDDLPSVPRDRRAQHALVLRERLRVGGTE
jgi:hypothetical protein